MRKDFISAWCVPIDISVSGSSARENPYSAEISGEFRGPQGEAVSLPGFYDGDGVWKVRFSPVKTGVWKYEIISGDVSFEKTYGEIECIENENKKIHGRIRVNPGYPYHFQYEDGAGCFMMVYECDWLWALDLGNPSGHKTQDFIDSIKNYGFNQIIMNVYAHDTPWAKGRTCGNDYGPPALYAWRGTNDNPEHSRFNSQFFRNFDKVMACLLNEGITAHILLKVYNKGVNWPEKYSYEDNLYFKYIVSRYQAYPNIIWDYTKEAYYETDKEYIKNRIELIKAYDSYKHLVTLHDDRIFYSDEKFSSNLDFLTTQQHHDFYYSTMYERQIRKWPVFNSEYGYEWGPSQKPLCWAAQSAEEVVRRAYEIVMAGGYPGYYYDYTAWDIIDYSITPKGYSYFKIMYEFFSSIEWWKLEPHREIFCCNGRCLADEGREYVMYVETNSSNSFNLKLQEESCTAVWINTHTGEKVPGDLSQKHSLYSGLTIAKNPFCDAPGILHIKVS